MATNLAISWIALQYFASTSELVTWFCRGRLHYSELEFAGLAKLPHPSIQSQGHYYNRSFNLHFRASRYFGMMFGTVLSRVRDRRSSICNLLNQWPPGCSTIRKLDLFSFNLKLSIINRRVISWSFFVSLFSMLCRQVITLDRILCDFIPWHFILRNNECCTGLKMKFLYFWRNELLRTHRILISIDTLHSWQMGWKEIFAMWWMLRWLERIVKMIVLMWVSSCVLLDIRLSEWRRQAACTGK